MANLNGTSPSDVQQLRQEVEGLRHELHQMRHQLADIRQNEQRCMALMAASPVGIFRTDLVGNCVYVNERWSEITGLASEEALGEQWSKTLHPLDRNRVVQAWYDAVQQQQPFRLEYRFLHSTGQVVWVLAQALPERDKHQNIVGYIGSLTNITERKKSEHALRISEERFRVTFEQVAVGFSHMDTAGRWLRVNQRLCEIVGYDRQELTGKTFRDLTYPADLESSDAMFQQALRGEIDQYSLEKRYIHRNGQPVWVNITVSLVHDPAEMSNGGQTTSQPSPYLIVVVEDIQERKQTELQLQERATELAYLNTVLSRTTTLLRRRNQELDQFAYVASHDLKAPLRAIANLSEWIEEDLAGALPDDNRRQMNLLRGRVHRLEALIDGLLEYSRVGRIQTKAERVDVGEMLHSLVDFMSPPPGFEIDIGPNMPIFTAKPLALQQVFLNLISNTFEHHPSPNRGHAWVTVQDTGRYYEFSVSDDGGGIDPRYHDKIFQIFQTLEARDTKESTGMGLSVVKKIIETEGGTISVESEMNQGTTFRFLWPRSPVTEDQ